MFALCANNKLSRVSDIIVLSLGRVHDDKPSAFSCSEILRVRIAELHQRIIVLVGFTLVTTARKQCPLSVNSGCLKQKDRLAAVSPNLTRLRLFLPFGLNHRRLALANRSLAFADTTSKAKGQNHRADRN